MRILPVIDILDGRVVRGVAGNRSEYRPIQSRWTDSADPENVVAALADAFGFRRFYVADLDGILFQTPHLDLYQRLSQRGYDLLIDAGVREVQYAAQVLDGGAQSAIVGLETLVSTSVLWDLVEQFTANRIVFSLDLKQGIPQCVPDSDWASRDPLEIAGLAFACGVRRMIVLDLADVGTNTGGSTSHLCRELRSWFSDLHLIAGGGVRGRDDLARWSEVGVEELLVASALHDGRLMPDDVGSIYDGDPNGSTACS